MQPEDVKKALEVAIPNCEAIVSSDGNHINIIAISEAFNGVSPVKKQQMVYGVLQEPLASGAIHAVHMQTYTPEAWAAKNS